MKKTILIILSILLVIINDIHAADTINNMKFADVIKEIKLIGKTDWKNKYPDIYSSSEIFRLDFYINANIRHIEMLDEEDYTTYSKTYTHNIGSIKEEIEKLGTQTRGRIFELNEIIRLKSLLNYDFYTAKKIEKIQSICDYSIHEKLFECKNLLNHVKLDTNVHINTKYIDDLIHHFQYIMDIKEVILNYKHNMCTSLSSNERVQCLNEKIKELHSYYDNNEISNINLKSLHHDYQTILNDLKLLVQQETQKISQQKKEQEIEKQKQVETEQMNSVIILIFVSILILLAIYLYMKIQNWKKNRPVCKSCNSFNMQLYKEVLLKTEFDYQRKNGGIDKRYDNNWKHEVYQGEIKCLDCGLKYDACMILVNTKYDKGKETNTQSIDLGKYQVYFSEDGSTKKSPFS